MRSKAKTAVVLIFLLTFGVKIEVWAEDSKASKESVALSPDPISVLSRIHRMNLDQIEIGRMARERATNAKVRALGERLVRDHLAVERRVARLESQMKIRITQIPASERHLELIRQLQGMTGEGFDDAFLAQVEGRQTHALAELFEIRQRVERGKLRTLVDEMIPILQQHRRVAANLTQAKES